MMKRLDSKSVLLTKELKADAWSEVEGLPLEEALRKRIQVSESKLRYLSVKLPIIDPRENQGAVYEDE